MRSHLPMLLVLLASAANFAGCGRAGSQVVSAGRPGQAAEAYLPTQAGLRSPEMSVGDANGVVYGLDGSIQPVLVPADLPGRLVAQVMLPANGGFEIDYHPAGGGRPLIQWTQFAGPGPDLRPGKGQRWLDFRGEPAFYSIRNPNAEAGQIFLDWWEPGIGPQAGSKLHYILVGYGLGEKAFWAIAGSIHEGRTAGASTAPSRPR